MDKVIEKSVTKIYEVVIGTTNTDGGTRSKSVKVGGQNVLPFLHFEGEMPNEPKIALEVWDRPPTEEWPWFADQFKDIVQDPLVWVKKAEDWGADLVCLRLISCHPDGENKSKEYAAEMVKKVLQTTSLPLMILGCGHSEKDSEILLYASESAKGEKCLLGMATKDNYKTVVAAAMASGHSVVAESPLDINLAKQLNILISDMGLSLDRVVMHPTTGGLGYGFEYCYSIMERCRLAGLQGDKVVATPIINMVSQETWKVKETKASDTDQPTWGKLDNRGPVWETTAAMGYLQSGSDILVLAHPESVKTVKKSISDLMKK